MRSADQVIGWGQMALDLIRVEQNAEWKARHSSLSAYIEHEAAARQTTKSTLWRLRSAGLYYLDILRRLDPAGDRLPALDDPRLDASPESLELAAKISRVAPEHLVKSLELGAAEGTITRRELRDLWETYRPVLGGKTKRGRGSQPPRFDSQNHIMRRALGEANTLARVVQSGPEWLGLSKTPHLYRIVHISGSETLRNFHSAAADIVILLAEKEQSTLMLHGVEAGFSPDANPFLQSYDPRQIGVDYLWFATAKKLFPEESAKLPPEIGILHVSPQSIAVARLAERLYAGDMREDLLRALLREVARSRRTVHEG